MGLKIFSEDNALELAEKLLQNDKNIKDELEEKIEALESPTEDTIIEIVDEVFDDRLDIKLEEYVQPIENNKILNLF